MNSFPLKKQVTNHFVSMRLIPNSEVTANFVFAFWPVVALLILPADVESFLSAALQEILWFPPALRQILDFWLVAAPSWKRVYVIFWFFNSFLAGFCYLWWLKNNAWHLDNMDRDASLWKALLLGVFALVVSIVFYFGDLFDRVRPLSDRVDLMINSELGLLLIMPFFILGASCAWIGGACCFAVVFLKLARMIKGGPNE